MSYEAKNARELKIHDEPWHLAWASPPGDSRALSGVRIEVNTGNESVTSTILSHFLEGPCPELKVAPASDFLVRFRAQNSCRIKS